MKKKRLKQFVFHFGAFLIIEMETTLWKRVVNELHHYHKIWVVNWNETFVPWPLYLGNCTYIMTYNPMLVNKHLKHKLWHQNGSQDIERARSLPKFLTLNFDLGSCSNIITYPLVLANIHVKFYNIIMVL